MSATVGSQGNIATQQQVNDDVWRGTSWSSDAGALMPVFEARGLDAHVTLRAVLFWIVAVAAALAAGIAVANAT